MWSQEERSVETSIFFQLASNSCPREDRDCDLQNWVRQSNLLLLCLLHRRWCWASVPSSPIASRKATMTVPSIPQLNEKVMGVGHARTETFYGVGAVKKSQLSVFTAWHPWPPQMAIALLIRRVTGQDWERFSVCTAVYRVTIHNSKTLPLS